MIRAMMVVCWMGLGWEGKKCRARGDGSTAGAPVI